MKKTLIVGGLLIAGIVLLASKKKTATNSQGNSNANPGTSTGTGNTAPGMATNPIVPAGTVKPTGNTSAVAAQTEAPVGINFSEIQPGMNVWYDNYKWTVVEARSPISIRLVRPAGTTQVKANVRATELKKA